LAYIVLRTRGSVVISTIAWPLPSFVAAALLGLSPDFRLTVEGTSAPHSLHPSFNIYQGWTMASGISFELS
jgi:hypothetical protein